MGKPKFTFSRERLFPGYDGITCKVNPAIRCDKSGLAFLTYEMLLLSGSDVFNSSYIAKSTDSGISFNEPMLQNFLETKNNGIRTVYLPHLVYNKYHDKFFGIGSIICYENDNWPIIEGEYSKQPFYYFEFDKETCKWGNPQKLDFPYDYNVAFPRSQFVELDNGDMIIPFYCRKSENLNHRFLVVTVRYRLENGTLVPIEAGTPIEAPEKFVRGFYEPSLTIFKGKYYLSLRSDETGLVAESDDGLTFSTPEPLVWTDGEWVGNYNTMTLWIKAKDALYLTYTRKNAHNDHVFRNRAPIFMTRFDTKTLRLIQSEEVILVPELGARLGNYNITDVSENEAWLITAEWMQGPEGSEGCEKYGSNNSLWRAKVKW